MTPRSFTLRPFLPAPRLPALEIVGTISRHGQALSLGYELKGDLAAVMIPEPAAKPTRRPGLWEATCFELFLAPRNSRGYWEFNLSPGGHWNVYSFEAYRQGMLEEQGFASLPFSVQSSFDSWRLALEVDLTPIISPAQDLDAALSAIITGKHGEVTYWALTHPGEQPDFHRRDSFIIEL